MSSTSTNYSASMPRLDALRGANPPTFFMDAIDQLRRDQATGYSSLDASTFEARSPGGMGLIDILERARAQRDEAAAQMPRRGTPIMSARGTDETSSIERS